MPDQADDLINKMYNNPLIDWTEDWKVVTLFIGGNDLCGYCNNIVGIFDSYVRN